MIQTEWNDPHNGAMDYEEYARDAIGILRQNGSDTRADALSRLLVRVVSLEAELAEARKDGERLSALQGGRLSTQYRDGATRSMDKWIVTFCATPIAGGSTLREAIDNAADARGTR